MNWIHVKRPTNNHVITKFEQYHNYHYRFPDGCELCLEVQYAWCHQCEQFVEAERLYTQQQIQQQINNLSAVRHAWSQTDSVAIERWKYLEYPLSDFRTSSQAYEGWKTALTWCKQRKSPPRCLECGSFTAVVMLPYGEEIAHPFGEGVIIVTGDDTLGGGIGGYLPPVFFDEEGIRDGKRGQTLVPL